MYDGRCWVAHEAKSVLSLDVMEHDTALDTARVQQRCQPGHSSHSQSACVEITGAAGVVLLASFGCWLLERGGRGGGGAGGG